MSKKKLGLWSSSSLVLGNMIGSGIFMLPAALAAFGAISFAAWICSALGALLLAFIFKNLSSRFPNQNGGPYIYTRKGLGEFPAYLVAWSYWISIWCTNAAIAVAFVSYLGVFFPNLETQPLLSILIGLIVVWGLTWVNTRKIIFSGRLQLVTTILKIVPLIAIILWGMFYVNWDYLTFIPETSNSFWTELTAAMTLTLFAFLGLESATIPSDNIENPKRNVPRATWIGTIAAILIYIMSSTIVMGLFQPENLQKSSSPFADAGFLLWGESARYLIAIGALISTFGALNGWILLQGQVPAAAAKDGLFPAFFAKKNKFGMPTWGLFASSLLVSIMVCLNFSKGLVASFSFILLLSTLMALLPYIFTVTAYLLILVQDTGMKRAKTIQVTLSFMAFAFLIWAVIGSGQESVFWGFILLLLGIPGYIWLKRKAP